VPPWRWIVSTEGALFPFQPLNLGVSVANVAHFPTIGTYESVESYPDGMTIMLQINGSQEPSGPAPGVTIGISIVADSDSIPDELGQIALLYPTAIAVHGPIAMFGVGPSVLIPNPVFITPELWSGE
jgi:hypothetical protein